MEAFKTLISRAFPLPIEHIDTDQIIPAEHLVYSTSDPEELKKYGHFALTSVPIEKAGLPFGDKPFIEGDITPKDLRSIYAPIAYERYCLDKREHDTLFYTKILGHSEKDIYTCLSYLKYKIK